MASFRVESKKPMLMTRVADLQRKLSLLQHEEKLLTQRMLKVKQAIDQTRESLDDAYMLDAAIDAEIDQLTKKIHKNLDDTAMVDETQFQIRKRKRFLQELGVRVVDDPSSELRKTYVQDMDRLLK